LKKFFSFIIFLCVMLMFTAQSLQAFEKGTKGLGGTIGFNGYKGSKEMDTRYSLSIAPQMSYFVLNNFCVDAYLAVSTAWAGNMSPSTGLGIGLGGRYFYNNFYGGAYFNYSASRSKTTILLEGDLVYDGFNWRKRSDLEFVLGRLFGISKNVYLDWGVYYLVGLGNVTNSAEHIDSYNNERSQFGTRAGISIFF